ncbi:uncharacterized protein LOC128206597 [Mya arenaria]|uniref:uncharacterized protein LOC128206597 n=1 Tax=Mya arenaria TaxID=6604 RepID=UPI0022E17A2E|nr:uncharacterized protein LOC128206597 [Mya arenaria]XP_052765133.1 uncharacterized protein LOC128206597 [Mya arenaria]
MASNEEHFTKLVLYLQKPCLKLFRALLNKCVETLYPGQTVYQILLTKKSILLNTRHGHNNKNRYFPVDATGADQPTNLDTWDIGMYVYILTRYCNWLGNQGHVIDIKSLRDAVCHLGFPQISSSDYERHFETIKKFIRDMLLYIGNDSLEQEIKLDVTNLEGPLTKDFIEYAQICHKLYQGDQRLMEIVQDHMSVTESHGQMFQMLFTELQEVKSRLPQNVLTQATPPDNASVLMRLKNCTPEEEDEVSDLLVGCFSDVIHQTEEFQVSAVDESEKLKSAVRQAFQELCHGRVSNAEQGCLILYLTFDSFESFLDFIDGVFSGAITDMFRALQTAIRDTFNKPNLEVDVVMNTNQFTYCFQYIMECLKRLLPSKQADVNDMETAAPSNQGEAEDMETAAPSSQGEAKDMETASPSSQGESNDMETAAPSSQGEKNNTETAAIGGLDRTLENTTPPEVSSMPINLPEKDANSSKKFAIVTPFISLDPSSMIAESLRTESQGTESLESDWRTNEGDGEFEVIEFEHSPSNANEGLQMMGAPLQPPEETTKPRDAEGRPADGNASSAKHEDRPQPSHSGWKSPPDVDSANSIKHTISQYLQKVKVSRADADELERQLQGELMDTWSESCELVKGTRIRVDNLGAYLHHLVDAYEGIDIATRRKMEGILFSREAWKHELIEWKINTGNESGSRYGMIAFCKSPDGLFLDCMCVLYKMNFKVSPQRLIKTRDKSALFGLITWTTTEEQVQERTLGAYSIKRLKNFFRLKALKGFYHEGIIDSIDYVRSLNDVP